MPRFEPCNQRVIKPATKLAPAMACGAVVLAVARGNVSRERFPEVEREDEIIRRHEEEE